MDKGSFIQMIFEIAAEGYADFGILPSLAISQGILESDWGKKHIENNIYGIKAGKSWTGKVALRNTREWDGEKYVIKQERFRAYSSFEESVWDYLKLLGKTKRYEKVKKARDYREASNFVYECGYATDPKYPQKLIKLIEENQLYKYDNAISISLWAEKAWDWAIKEAITDGSNPKGFATREEVATMLYRACQDRL